MFLFGFGLCYLLLVTNAVSPVRACLIIHMMGEVWWDPKKEDDRGPLGIQSSLVGRYVFKLNGKDDASNC